jgi:hypothetical protein
VWSGNIVIRREFILAVTCGIFEIDDRIFMNLHVRERKAPDEFRREIRVSILTHVMKERFSRRGFIQQTSKFKMLMLDESISPFAKQIDRYIKTFTDFFDRLKMTEVFGQNTGNKEDTVSSVRNEMIRKDGVGMVTTVTDHSCNAERKGDLFSTDKVGDSAIVVGVNMAFAFCFAYGTGFFLGNELFHVSVEKNF